MSRGVKDLRELINVSRLTHRPGYEEAQLLDSEQSDAAGEAPQSSGGDSVEASRLSSASSGTQSASCGACGSDSGFGGGSPLSPPEAAPHASAEAPAAAPSSADTSAPPPPGGSKRRRSRARRSGNSSGNGERRQLPPLQRYPDLGVARVRASSPLPPTGADDRSRFNYDAVMENIDSASVTDWLERATIFAHELNIWCNEDVNFCAFADFWLSAFPDARKREIVELELSVLQDELTFAFREGQRLGNVTAGDIQRLLHALFHEYPDRLLGPNHAFFFLDYLDVLSSERTNDYRLLLTDVRLSTRNRLYAQWFLSIRSFALLSTWSAVVGFFRELTSRGNLNPVRPKTANARDIPAASAVGARTIQAVSHNFVNVLDYFVQTKVDLKEFKDEKGRNLIFLAVSAQQPAVLKHLLTHYPKQVDPNCRSDTGNTPLHVAVSCGNLQLVRALVEANADVNAANPSSDNSTPLHLAVLYGHSAIVAYLLDKGADTKCETNGQTAIDLAREFERTYIVEMLSRLSSCDEPSAAADVGQTGEGQ